MQAVKTCLHLGDNPRITVAPVSRIIHFGPDILAQIACPVRA